MRLYLSTHQTLPAASVKKQARHRQQRGGTSSGRKLLGQSPGSISNTAGSTNTPGSADTQTRPALVLLWLQTRGSGEKVKKEFTRGSSSHSVSGPLVVAGPSPAPRAPASASLRAAPSPGARSQPNRDRQRRASAHTRLRSLCPPLSSPAPRTRSDIGSERPLARAPHATCPR